MNDYVINNKSSLGIKPVFYAGIIVILISFFTPCFGQSKLYLQHRDKPNRQKKISPKKEYIIQTKDTTFYKYRIISFSDSTLKVGSELKKDFRDIPTKDIEQLEKAKKVGVFELIGTLGVIGLTITPIIWATEGNEEALGMLGASGVLLAASVPVILIKDIGRKKDLRKKWKIYIG